MLCIIAQHIEQCQGFLQHRNLCKCMKNYFNNKIQTFNKTDIIFFDTKKEPKKRLEGCEFKTTHTLRLILFKY